ncbi:unnamed protein product [Timema podura]|uniref:Uncharacterized protein n=1 Tax=Timema podura TaxID=61482 RepID=A0ABN7NZI5_TIMPD|nr:unnamed protein product [Timema podura]
MYLILGCHIWRSQCQVYLLGTPTDLPNCRADPNAVHGITSKMELFVSSQIFQSFQYLLMSFTYSSATEERPGLQKLFKKQSNSLWNNAVHLIQFISQRGGILNFSEPTSNKEDDLIRLNFGELEDLSHALDMEKTLERQAICIHRELAKCQSGSFNSESGVIYLNKTNIRHVNALQLRDKIGFVQQNTFLFGPTISDAICCGRIDVMPLDVMQAAVSADAHNLIVAMPKQYQTPLSHFLSQEKLKQRLAVARALVFKPQLVMLDNATSSLTDEEEIKLHQSIIRSEPHRILIIVSPRISTMKMATNILYLVKGVVIEKGTYEELMGKKGKFFNMIEHVTTVYGHDKNTDFIDDFQPSISPQPHNNHQKSSTQKKWAYQNKDEPHFSNGTVYLSRLPTWGHQLDDPTLNYFERPTKILPWTKVLRMNSKEWPYLLTGCIAATINGVSLIAYGILFGECIIVSVLWEYREVYNRFALFINIFLIAGVISGIGVMVQGYAVSVASSKLVQRLRTKAFSAILRQNFEWFSAPENNLESLLELLRTDTVNVHMAAGPRLVSATQTTCIVLGCVFLAISYNYILGLVVIIFMPFILLGSIILRRLLGEDKISEGIELNMIKIMLGEVVNEIEVVIGLNVQEMILNKHVSTFEQCYKKQRTSVKVRGEREINLINLETLLRHIGWADGNPTFFRRSVFENIAYGDNTRDIRINEIVTVAEKANIHNYIITLPDGYSTIIDETIKMTYGQKIRLSLARALIRDPEILLLDNLQVLEDEDGEVLAEAAIRNASLDASSSLPHHYSWANNQPRSAM